MEDNLGTVIYSTKSQLEEFRESVIWKDIVRELDQWLEGFDIERNSIVDDAKEANPSTASVLMLLGDINGRKKAVEYMKELPNVFIKILELNSELNKKEDEDGDAR